MSAAYIPEIGSLFYVESKRWCYRGGAIDSILTGVLTKEEKVRDRSYEDRIFRMVAIDDVQFVADAVHGGYRSDERLMLQRRDYDMRPVGSAVAKALGLDIAAGSEA